MSAEFCKKCGCLKIEGKCRGGCDGEIASKFSRYGKLLKLNIKGVIKKLLS